MDDLSFLTMVERARKETLRSSNFSSFYSIEEVLKRELEKEFKLSVRDTSTILEIDRIKIDKVIDNRKKFPTSSIVGGAMVLLGQPFLNKRFVMKGSAGGTSIASKYLSKAFPQELPIRIFNTKVFGRALGRAVPYVGWGLLIIDTIELIVTEIVEDDKDPFSFSGFRGGKGGGGGSSSIW